MITAPYGLAPYGGTVALSLPSSTEPVTVIEVEFTPGNWTDVSSYLRAGSSKRGKAKAIDSPAPGFASFTMRNDERQFDSEYSGNISPGNVLPEKAIRARVDFNGINYPLFTGQIDRIVQRYDGPHNSVAILECSDGLGRLAGDELGSPWEVQMGFQSPRAWYRLGESQGPYANERMAGRYGTFIGTPSFGEEGFVHDDDGCVLFDTADDYLLLPPGILRTDVAAPWQLSFLLNYPEGLIGGGSIDFLLYDALFPYGLTIWLDSSGFLNVRTWTPGAATYTYIRSGGFFGDVTSSAGSEHLGALITIQAATTTPYLRIYNGNIPIHDAATLVGTGSVLPDSYRVVGASANPWRIDEIQTYDDNLSSTLLGEMSIASDGWAVDDANDRIERILNAVGWDPALRDITTDWDTFLQRTTLQESPISHLAKIAATAEHRAPFVARDGTLRIISRQEHSSAPYTTPQGTLGDDPGELGYTEMGDYSLDTATVENVVRRVWIDADGNETHIVAFDAPSLIAGQRPRVGDEITSEYVSPDHEYVLAAIRAAKRAQLTPVIEGLKILPRKDPANLFPLVLGRELGDRLTWVRRPQRVGDPIERDVILEGVAHDFGPKRWETRFLIDATDAFDYFHFDETEWDSDEWRFAG